MEPEMKAGDLISAGYCEQNRMLHEAPEGFGGSGWKHFKIIRAYIIELNARNVLDYGCGERTLRKAFLKEGVAVSLHEYDPALKKLSRLPSKPSDLVVCTDVLEHVEPDKVDAVLAHIASLTSKGAYLVIANRLANKILPDGRNAHLIVEPPEWWLEKIASASWHIDRHEVIMRKQGTEPHETRVWIKR